MVLSYLGTLFALNIYLSIYIHIFDIKG